MYPTSKNKLTLKITNFCVRLIGYTFIYELFYNNIISNCHIETNLCA